MRKFSTNEIELLTFFEVEPSQTDHGIPWVYNDSAYQVSQGGLSLSFAVAPSYGDARLILRREDQILYELNAMGILDLQYFNENGRESLKLSLSEKEWIWIRIKPRIELKHELTESL